MKFKIETSTQIFIDGQPEPVRIVDFSIDTSWSKEYIENHIATICYPLVKQMQIDSLGFKEMYDKKVDNK